MDMLRKQKRLSKDLTKRASLELCRLCSDISLDVNYSTYMKPYWQKSGKIQYVSTDIIFDFDAWYYEHKDIVKALLNKYKIYLWVSIKEKEDGSNDVWYVGNAKTIPITKKDGAEVNHALYQPRNTLHEAWDTLLIDVITKLKNGTL